jgi:hypothetical protein
VGCPAARHERYESVLRACAVIAILFSVSAARAGEGESAVSPSLGWAGYATTDKDGKAVSSSIGAAAGATYERGISEALSWRVSLVGAGFTADKGRSVSAWGAAGLVYRFDVLKYVPYVEVSVGGVWIDGATLHNGMDPLLELGGGLDVLSSRDRSWGGEIRLGSFAGDTTILTVGVRTTWRWGYF